MGNKYLCIVIESGNNMSQNNSHISGKKRECDFTTPCLSMFFRGILHVRQYCLIVSNFNNGCTFAV